VGTADVFVRRASGLRREWQSYDAFFYNFLQINPAFNIYIPFLFTLIPGLFPGANIPLSWAMAVIILIPTMITYAMMSASMPRSGGEYVFISRLVHPSLGFSFVTLGFTLANLVWITSVGQLMAQQGIGIPLYLLGRMFDQPGLAEAGAWAVTGTGSLTIIVVLGIFLPALLIAFGMRIYAYVQRVFMAVAVVAAVFLLIAFVTITQPAFAQSFNSFSANTMGAGAYSQIIESAKGAGYVYTDQFGFSDTIVSCVLAMSMLMWAWFSTPLLGEIKSAQKVKSTILFIAGPMVAVGLYQVAFSVLFPGMVGREFLGAIGYLWNTGGIDVSQLPVPPYHAWLVGMAMPFWWVAILLMFGETFHCIYANCSNLLGPVRYLFAQAFDRVLPARIAHVDPRTHSPLVAILIMVVGAVIWSVWQVANPALWTYIMSAAFATLACVIGVCVAGAVFPYRMKEVYKASPIAKYQVGGVPLVTILGILGVLSQIFLGYYYVTVPELGMVGNPTSMIALTAIAIGLIIYYFIAKAYRKRQGISMEFAFGEIPPE